MEPMNSPLPDALAGKLQRIEDLAEKLVYVKWSQEFFVLLQKAAQDVLTLARPRLEYRKVVVLAERLERQISQSLEKGELPGGADREQLIAVVDALCRAASRPGRGPSRAGRQRGCGSAAAGARPRAQAGSGMPGRHLPAQTRRSPRAHSGTRRNCR